MKCACRLLFSALTFAAPAWGQSPPLLFDFSRVQHKPSEVTTPASQKAPAGTVEAAGAVLSYGTPLIRK